jgi:hypothetical protein
MLARVLHTDDKSSLNRCWLPVLRQPPRRCPDGRTRWSKGSPTRERTGRLNERTIGIGPQIGFVIPISEGYQGYLNPSGLPRPGRRKSTAIASRPGRTGRLICPTGGLSRGVSSLFSDFPKNISVPTCPKSILELSPSRPTEEGRCATSPARGGMRWTRRRSRTRGAEADGEDVWS